MTEIPKPEAEAALMALRGQLFAARKGDGGCCRHESGGGPRSLRKTGRALGEIIERSEKHLEVLVSQSRRDRAGHAV